MMIHSAVVIALLAAGLFFLVVAAVGFVRFPDVFCRLHITGVIDTLGAPLILLAAAVYPGLTLESGKLVLAIIFLYVTSPLVGHLLAQAAVEAGYTPVLEDTDDTARARHYASDQPEVGGDASRGVHRLELSETATSPGGGEA